MAASKVVGTDVRLDGTFPIYGADTFAGKDFLTALEAKLSINIISESEDSIEFDLVGVEAPLANALRRILLAEVPSVAIETVFLQDNTSIIQDEVLSHRLGLVPLNIDPRKVQMKAPGGTATSANTVVFCMDVTGAPPPAPTDGRAAQRFHHVYASSLQWVPQEGQKEQELGAVDPAPVHGDILLAKLQPGQRIVLEAHAVKGVGKDHAKFSPVSTASYRLLPAVHLLKPVYDDLAVELAARSRVFDAVPCTDGSGHKTQAVVARPRLCNMSREMLRDPRFADSLRITRVNDHFIFSVETTGALSPRDIVREAFGVLREKVTTAGAALEAWVSGEAIPAAAPPAEESKGGESP